MTPTDAQRRAIETTARNVLVLAGPGSGKTEVIVKRVKRLIFDGVDPSDIAVVTYTNAAARVVEERVVDKAHPAIKRPIELGFVGTLHAFCLKHIGKHGPWRNVTVLDDDEADDLLERSAEGSGVRLNQATRSTLRRIRDNWLHEQKLPETPARIAVRAYYREMISSGRFDRNSILTFAWGSLADPNQPRRAWRHLIVDEFQDAAEIDARIYEWSGADNRFYVGDPMQCQPAGTLVRMSDGTDKPIEEVAPIDCVWSYERHSSIILKKGIVAAVASRPFKGRLYKVEAAGKVTETTGNHRWLVQWVEVAQRRQSKAFCTYLMRKGDNFRIGKSRLFGTKEQCVLGAVTRLNQERADAMWILEVHPDAQSALRHEAILVATYGLSDVCFVSGSNHHIEQPTINAIFAAIPGQLAKAAKCLEDHGRELDYPIARKGEKRTRRTRQEIEACNLIDDVMQVPLAPDAYQWKKRDSEWAPIKVAHREFTGLVYSLDIHKHHKYVANGIVTCNSIFGFRGGDVMQVAYMAKNHEFEVHRLEENFRSGSAICLAAANLAGKSSLGPYLTTRPPEGREASVYARGFQNAAQEAMAIAASLSRDPVDAAKVAVLARSNVVADEVAWFLRDQGVPVRRLATRERPADWAHALDVLAGLAGADADKLETSLLESAVTIESTLAIKARFDELPVTATLSDLHASLKLDANVRSMQGEGCYVGTIHSAKGMEFDTVVLAGFEDEEIPGRRKGLEVDEERRVAYVGMTRARERLVVTHSKWRQPAWSRGFQPRTPSRFIAEAGIGERNGEA